MEKERIEIFPGHWIEVTPKIKRAAGLRKKARVLATLDGGHVQRAIGAVAKKRGPSKYSLLLIDEAIRIFREESYKAAEKATGVPMRVIKHYNDKYKARHGLIGPPRNQRYTMEQKQACVKLAMELMQREDTVERRLPTGRNKVIATHRVRKWNKTAAFIEAGRRLGMNGKYVADAFSFGFIPWPPSSHQPESRPPSAEAPHTPQASG